MRAKFRTPRTLRKYRTGETSWWPNCWNTIKAVIRERRPNALASTLAAETSRLFTLRCFSEKSGKKESCSALPSLLTRSPTSNLAVPAMTAAQPSVVARSAAITEVLTENFSLAPWPLLGYDPLDERSEREKNLLWLTVGRIVCLFSWNCLPQ